MAAVLLLAGVVGAAAPAAAASAIEVEIGWAGRYQGGRDIPVRAAVTSDRLLRGTLRFRLAGGMPSVTVLEVPVELAGGSTTELTVPMPVLPVGGPVRVDVQLLDGDRVIARGSGEAVPAGGDELVGLLVGALAGREVPSSAPLILEGSVARFAAVTDADMSVAPASLASLDVLAATPEDVGGLTPQGWRAVARWIADGGQLLVDAAPGERVPLLPASWTPGPTGRAPVGAGEVRFASGAIARGAWAGLIEPTPGNNSARQMGFAGEPLEMVLARDAGLRFPKLNLLLALLAAYALVLVPLTTYLLRRAGRGELAWVMLPLLALGCTGLAYGSGRGIRDDSRTVQASVLRTDGPSWSSSTVAVISRASGEEEVVFPRGWSTAAGSGFVFDPGLASAPATAVFDGRQLRTRQELAAGQFALRSARGPVEIEGALEVTAETEGDEVVGTVRNTLDVALEEVGIFHDKAGVNLGRLGPGQERRWRVGGQAAGGDPFQLPAHLVWQDASGMHGPVDQSSIVSMGLWGSFFMELPSSATDTGFVLAAGWTRRLPGAASVGGERPPARTVVVGSTLVTPGTGPLRGAAVHAAVTRSPFSEIGGVNPQDPTVVRFTLPQTADGQVRVPRRLVVLAPQQAEISAWAGGAWTSVPAVPGTALERAPGTPFGISQEYEVPAEAVNAGRVWVRFTSTHGDPFLSMQFPMVLEERS